MGHEIHTKLCILIDSRDFGESGKILSFLTPDTGILGCLATGVREQKSKMAKSIIPMSLCSVDYVEGREVNRLTGIEVKETLFNVNAGNALLLKRKVLSNIVNFIMRTVVGETENEALFNNFKEGIILLNLEKENEKEYYEIFEIIWLITILVTLGYWEEGKNDNFSKENFEKVKEEKASIVVQINSSIKGTHL